MRIRLSFDTNRVKGWNEVDAVGLLDAQAKTHWATSAYASSFHGEKPAKPQIVSPVPIRILPRLVVDPEIARLRAEVERLKKRLRELEKG